MGLPDGLPQEVVWLAELYGNHDTTMHGLIQVIWTIGGHDNATIVPEEGKEEEEEEEEEEEKEEEEEESSKRKRKKEQRR